MRYDSAEHRCRPGRRELENRCWPPRGGSGAHPTAIAIMYWATESIPGTATHRLGTSSSCVPSPNASSRKAKYDEVLLAAGPSGRQQISATGQEGHQP